MAPGNLTTKPVSGDEIEAFRALLVPYFEELNQYAGGSTHAAEDADRVCGPEFTRWWALDGEARAGFAVFRVYSHEPHIPGWEGSIDEFYVLPAHRRQGLGRALAGAVMDHMIQRGCDRIKLTVLTRNEPAMALWESLGFRIFLPLGEGAVMQRRIKPA